MSHSLFTVKELGVEEKVLKGKRVHNKFHVFGGYF